MNVYRTVALGFVVAAASAGCDAPNSQSSTDRQDSSMRQSVAEAENQGRDADSGFAAVEDPTEEGHRDLPRASNNARNLDASNEVTDTMQADEYGLAREKCDEFSAGNVKDACIEQAKTDFARN